MTRLLIASDIHGCLHATQQITTHFEQGGYDYLILLGDILNHGPRNPLPAQYDPIGVANRLNHFAEKIIAVRGNCDSEVDQALLHFPMLAEYNQLLVDGRRLFLCHGHTWSVDHLPPLTRDDLFCFGHIHLPKLEQTEQCWVLNPGSAAMPRDNHPPSFACVTSEQMSVLERASGDTLLTATWPSYR